MEKLEALKGIIDAMHKDAEKFFTKGQNSAGTRLRKALNELRKSAQGIRNDIQAIRAERKVSKSSGQG